MIGAEKEEGIFNLYTWSQGRKYRAVVSATLFFWLSTHPFSFFLSFFQPSFSVFSKRATPPESHVGKFCLNYTSFLVVLFFVLTPVSFLRGNAVFL
jgi:hypothetical protein